MARSAKNEAVKVAAEIVGGPAKLRDRLQASSADMAAWLAGTKEPPQDVFLRVVEIILDELERS